MGLLTGKKGLVIGVANQHSLAWGIARALHGEGADLGFTYHSTARGRRTSPLAASLRANLIEQCDVRSDEEIAALMRRVRDVYGALDIIVHAPVAAKPVELSGPYLGTTREGFLLALETSAYSLTAIIRAADRLLNPGASIITLSCLSARRVVAHHNVLGVAKAALEASVRYLAADLGPRRIRVNAISSGPIRTLSSSAIADFGAHYKSAAESAPLRRHVTIDDIGKTALWLCSDWSSAVTGETIHVDAGLHQMGFDGRAGE
jgi:enoyl-[acyl-carrier protein] reductase I